MNLQALAAAVLQIKFIRCGALAVAVFGYIQKLPFGVNLHCGNNIIVLLQCNRLYPCCGSAHGTHILLGELNAHTAACCHENFIPAVCCHYGNQVILLAQIQRNQTALADICKAGHICFLD